MTVTTCEPTANAAYALGAHAYANNTAQALLISNSEAYITYLNASACSISCSLYQTGCTTVYTGSKVTLAANGAVSATQNELNGYSEQVCVKCQSTGGAYSYEVTKEITVQ